MIKKNTLLTILFFVFSLNISFAQTLWKRAKVDNDFTQQKSILYKKNFPKKYTIMSLELTNFNNQLRQKSKNTNSYIQLPDANGNLKRFKIKESSYLAPELAAKFPMIKSYSAQGIDDPTATAKVSFGSDGLHAIIFSGKNSTVYIDPYTKNQKQYIIYNRSDLSKSDDNFQCKIEENIKQTKKTNSFSKRNANDGKLRSYRLAVVTTGEYSQFHINRQGVSSGTDEEKKAAVISAVNTSITRVNSVFEKDLGVNMILVSNNDEIVFLDANTDDLSNDNAGELIDQSQVKCDDVIGDNNYDIGHTFSTGGGGLAQLRSVCVNDFKAKGVTGSSQPVNDPYDIDFVAHEIGHQFGATHTQNNDCQRSSTTSVEPGSGSTIMGYAGICSPNVQNKSDDHFHAVSIAQMWSHIQNSGSCATETDTGNNPPTANAGNDYSIPKSTPFILKGEATDADGTSSLTYNWEQIDNEIAVMPPVTTNKQGPLFRSLPSSESPNRFIPEFSTVISGNTSSTWEVLPSVAREINFALTVRDNNSGGGNTVRDDIKVTVVDAPPFTISDQPAWAPNSSRNIKWIVGKTNVAPINCQKVNIKLSIDGGNNFDIILATDTDNDGNEAITLPNLAETEDAILMIEAVDNIFYNVTSKFTIGNSPDFILSDLTGDKSICNSITDNVEFELDFLTSNNFNETVSFQVSGTPENSNFNLSSNSLSSDGKLTLSVNSLEEVTSGVYNIDITSTSSSLTKTTTVTLEVKNSICNSSGNTEFQTGTTLVEFNTINNATSNKTSGYSDFKNLSTTVNLNESYSLTVNTNTDDAADEQYTTTTIAWIDWDQNCQFDQNERYDLGTVTGSSNGQTSLSPLVITVPENASLGSTILRVTTKFSGDGSPSSCENGFDGEVEDYTIVVEEELQPEFTLFKDLKTYPIPANGKITVNFRVKNQDEILINLFDLRGALVSSQKFSTQSSIFLREVEFNANSGLYLLQIQNDGKQITRKIILE